MTTPIALLSPATSDTIPLTIASMSRNAAHTTIADAFDTLLLPAIPNIPPMTAASDAIPTTTPHAIVLDDGSSASTSFAIS